MNNNLIVNRAYNLSSNTYRFLILIFIIPSLFLFLIFIPLNFIAGLQFLIFVFIIIIIPLLILYFYYKIRKVKWDLNKDSQKAFNIKIYPRYKLLKEINFSEIEYLIFRHYKRAGSALSPEIYSLSFFTGKLKEPTIYIGLIEECKTLGIKISEFLGKSLYYHNGEWKEKIIF